MTKEVFLRQNVLSMSTTVADLASVVRVLGDRAKCGDSAYVCVSNVHMCMETFDDEVFRSVVNDADYVVADGKPIQFAQRMLGWNSAGQVRGMDLTLRLCELAELQGLHIGFYGSTSAVLDEMILVLKARWPRLSIVYKYSPPFRALSDEEDNAICAEIESSGVQLLFVGLGCPKQERWMASHRNRINSVQLGVGAAFDFIAGHKRHAPDWMQKAGLEWLFRLMSEPSRLWKRYLKQNPRFIWYFMQQWLLGRQFDRL